MRVPLPENSASPPSGLKMRTRERPASPSPISRMPSPPAPRSGWQIRRTRAGVGLHRQLVLLHHQVGVADAVPLLEAHRGRISAAGRSGGDGPKRPGRLPIDPDTACDGPARAKLEVERGGGHDQRAHQHRHQHQAEDHRLGGRVAGDQQQAQPPGWPGSAASVAAGRGAGSTSGGPTRSAASSAEARQTSSTTAISSVPPTQRRNSSSSAARHPEQQRDHRPAAA